MCVVNVHIPTQAADLQLLKTIENESVALVISSLFHFKAWSRLFEH